MNAYTEQGFESRRDYLENVADEYGVSLEYVITIASMLGPDEDFDGLLAMVEDIAY